MYRNADGFGLVSNCPGYGLAYPPGGIGTKLITSAIIKLIDSSKKTDIAFLDEI
jgi:hypothetical protein